MGKCTGRMEAGTRGNGNMGCNTGLVKLKKIRSLLNEESSRTTS